MGRLKLPQFPVAVYVRAIFLLVAVAFAVFFYLRSSHINEPTASQIQDYLSNNELQVSTEVVNDFQQIYFVFDGQRVSVTSGKANHTNPIASGKYIVWTETPYQQNTSLMVLYDVLTKTKTQLTFTGTSLRPGMDGNKVVWEDWSSSQPQVYYYDGVTTQQISRGYPSVRPAIKDHQIAYAQELSINYWQTVVYNTQTKQQEVLATGTQEAAGWPKFVDGQFVADKP